MTYKPQRVKILQQRCEVKQGKREDTYSASLICNDVALDCAQGLLAGVAGLPFCETLNDGPLDLVSIAVSFCQKTSCCFVGSGVFAAAVSSGL